jgi:hypothetical protein
LLREIGDWNRYLQEEEEGNLVNKIRKCSLAGRPCGDEAFIETLESRFSRRLKPILQGRPRKVNNGRYPYFLLFSARKTNRSTIEQPFYLSRRIITAFSFSALPSAPTGEAPDDRDAAVVACWI